MLRAVPGESFEARSQALHEALARLPGAVVAFSGGVDSTMLLAACRQALGERVVAVTADSASLPRRELQAAAELCASLGVRHVVLPTRELDRQEYKENNGDRCYHCKQELFTTLAARRSEVAPQDWPVLYGAITDDFSDHRPGQRAAQEHGVLAPLADAGFTKADVRRWSHAAGLPTADKPSSACLSSRVPYGTAIDAQLLAKVERAEQALAALGLRQFRVRHHGDLARVEVAADEIEHAFARRLEMWRALRAAGYLFASLDLQGYRSGSLNELLDQGGRR